MNEELIPQQTNCSTAAAIALLKPLLQLLPMMLPLLLLLSLLLLLLLLLLPLMLSLPYRTKTPILRHLSSNQFQITCKLQKSLQRLLVIFCSPSHPPPPPSVSFFVIDIYGELYVFCYMIPARIKNDMNQ
jgi:hypothetical protein